MSASDPKRKFDTPSQNVRIRTPRRSLEGQSLLAGIEASAAVQRARPGAESIARNRRRFRIAVLILFLFLASIIAAIWLAERATQGS